MALIFSGLSPAKLVKSIRQEIHVKYHLSNFFCEKIEKPQWKVIFFKKSIRTLHASYWHYWQYFCLKFFIKFSFEWISWEDHITILARRQFWKSSLGLKEPPRSSTAFLCCIWMLKAVEWMSIWMYGLIHKKDFQGWRLLEDIFQKFSNIIITIYYLFILCKDHS